MKALTVTYERFDDGWWVSRIEHVTGVHSNGRTIDEARRRVREALAEATDEGWDKKKAAAVELVDDIKLPRVAKKAIANRAKALKALEIAARRLEVRTADAIGVLSEGMGLSVRDIGAFLDISHQRVHQLIEGSKPLLKEIGMAYRSGNLTLEDPALESASTNVSDRVREFAVAYGHRRVDQRAASSRRKTLAKARAPKRRR